MRCHHRCCWSVRRVGRSGCQRQHPEPPHSTRRVSPVASGGETHGWLARSASTEATQLWSHLQREGQPQWLESPQGSVCEQLCFIHHENRASAWSARSLSPKHEPRPLPPPSMPMDNALVPCVRRPAMRDACACSHASALAAHFSRVDVCNPPGAVCRKALSLSLRG